MTENSLPRVLHICKVFLPEPGGVQKVVHNITSFLKGYSHSVTTSGQDGAIVRQQIDRANVFRCRSYAQIASMPIAPSLITRVIKQSRKFQLIALHYPFPLAELALLFTFWAPPIVVHWHSDIIAQKKLRWLVAPFTLVMLMRAKAIVVTSERMIEQSFFLRRFRRKIVLIPYGVKSVPLSSDPPASDPLETGQSYFIIVGRHVSYKGIEVAIRALKGVQARLIIVGDGPLFEQHKNLVSDLGLVDRVEFKRDLSDSKIIKLLRRATALVVPSVMGSEAFALVQLEAMRLGKAVINTNLQTSVPWVARHQQEALTVPVNDAQALADAMQRLSANPKLAQELGANGLQRYRQQFSEERFTAAIDDLYSSLINPVLK